ncbi:MAG: hypothetical protein Q7V63_06955 [Gammaproteobacteria bacterium]|nr:hypothetical protein [Gammaproteobacteria bacterium]
MSLKLNVEKLTWKEARKDILKVNPDLAKIIDKLSPGDEYKLIKARYPFGQNILDQGVLHLPSDNGNISMNHPEIDPEFHVMLGYNFNTMPMGIVLNKSIELYLTVDSRTIPFSIMKPGKIFALWTVMEMSASAHIGRIWNITAGARSLIMLPKISDAVNFKKIKREFNLSLSAPNDLLDQWNTFSSLANHPTFPQPWEAEVIYFSNKWFDNDKDDDWRLFRYFLMSSAWHATAFLRNQVIFDFTFSLALEKNLRPNPYISDTTKHLYNIGTGAYPGFVVASDDCAAPISTFQDIFANIYGLKYAPLIVHPGYFSEVDPMKPCYYALQSPSLMDFSPKTKKASSKFEDIGELRSVVNGVTSYILQNKLGLENTPIYKWAKNTQYDYFHTESDSYGGNILLTKTMPNGDSNILTNMNNFSSLDFPENSPFLRGCIRLSIK